MGTVGGLSGNENVFNPVGIMSTGTGVFEGTYVFVGTLFPILDGESIFFKMIFGIAPFSWGMGLFSRLEIADVPLEEVTLKQSSGIFSRRLAVNFHFLPEN